MSFVGRLAAWALVGRAVLASRRGGDAPLRGAEGPPPGDSRARRDDDRDDPSPAEREGVDDTVPPQQAGGAGPDSPLELPKQDWKSTGKRTLKEIKADRVTLVAAGMAYYAFLAVFPAIIAGVGILSLIDAPESTIKQITTGIESTLPGSAGRILTTAINNASDAEQGALLATILGIAVALWSATSGFVALQAGLDVAYDIPEERKFVGKRLVALALIVATGLLGAVPSPFLAFGASWPWQVLGWVLTVVAVMILFSIYYYLGPNRDKPSWRWVSPGSVLGAVLWLIVGAAFSIYVAMAGQSSYEETYGSLAGVVILILWLYLSSLAILIGGELNAETERQAEARRRSDARA
ncbi:MAG TPA: YihY/virulence factor BrkB family protein [Actinomycetota bacterium]|nr:YihY/virulence factor BrkB family protein [Actinomycetota bacterium]